VDIDSSVFSMMMAGGFQLVVDGSPLMKPKSIGQTIVMLSLELTHYLKKPFDMVFLTL
jgi:hypothetical protein